MSTAQSKRFREIALNIGKVFLAVAIVTLMVRKGALNLSDLKPLLNWQVGALALGLLVFNHLLVAWRFRILLGGESLRISMWQALQLTLIGTFFNFAIFGGVGGDLVKGYIVTRQFPTARLHAAICVLMDRVLGLFTMVAMAAAVMMFDFQRTWRIFELRAFFIVLMAILGVFCIFLALAFSRRLKEYSLAPLRKVFTRWPLPETLRRVLAALLSYGDRKPEFFKAVVVSLFSQITNILLMAWVGFSLGHQDVPLTTYFVAVPLGFMAIAVPISPAGIGVGQAAFYFLFKIYLGYETNLGTNVITSFQLLSAVLGLGGAFIYLSYKGHKTAELASYKS